jgi:hypothetical protein
MTFLWFTDYATGINRREARDKNSPLDTEQMYCYIISTNIRIFFIDLGLTQLGEGEYPQSA